MGGAHAYCNSSWKQHSLCYLHGACFSSECERERFSVKVHCGCAGTGEWHHKFQANQTSHPLFVTILYLLAYLLSSLASKSLRQFIDLTVGVLSHPGRQYLRFLSFELSVRRNILVPFNSSFPISFIEIQLLKQGKAYRLKTVRVTSISPRLPLSSWVI